MLIYVLVLHLFLLFTCGQFNSGLMNHDLGTNGLAASISKCPLE